MLRTMKRLRLAVVLIAIQVVAALAAACGHTPGQASSSPTGSVPDGSLDSAAIDGGPGADGGLSLSSPDAGMTALGITPANSTVMVPFGQQTPTVTFTATVNGAAVPAAFSLDLPQIGTLGSGGVMTPTGQLGGTAKVTASYGGQTASTSITIVIVLVDNGPPGGPDAGADAEGAGGNGGVGGAGVGGPVSSTTQSLLEGAATTDPGLAWLYPYDKTVWPQGVLPPLLQWSAGQSYDAVYIQLEEKGFQYQGFFSATATPFVNHPLLPTAWNTLVYSNQGEPVTVSLTFSANGVAYGPITESWIIASGSLTGTVYYNSYGTSLVRNFCCAMDGSLFGGATLAIAAGATSPTVVAGTNSGSVSAPDQSGCRVCHSVSANGSTLITQHGDNYAVSSAYGLTNGNAETVMMPEDFRFAFPALSPDGTFLFSNAAQMIGVSPSTPSALYAVPSGSPIASTGIPAGLLAGSPAFSPDGTHVAFNYFGDGMGGGDKVSLAIMDFAQPSSTFSNFTVLDTPAVPDAGASPADIYPAFLPTNTGIVFEQSTGASAGNLGETAGGVAGQLWWIDVATRMAAPLATLNGVGYLPTGPNNHMNDEMLNYEPTVNPVPSGGYAWVVFTSRRLYGNVATIDPYSSDPRGYSYTTLPTTKKLWVAAIDLNAAPGTDPSHPAFYLPGQELYAGNSRGYWVVDPCKGDGDGCQSGDQCCNGYCQQSGDGGGFVCGSQQPGCSMLGNRCMTASDCCGAAQGIACIDGFCAQPAPQ